VPARTFPRRFEFHPAAEEEFFAALRFYRDTESGKVASDFDAELRRCVELVLHNPEMAPHFGRLGARGKLLRRFPYTLVYALQEDRIYVLAVAHQSRRPRYWTDRLRG
jgi:toxin ParE1/3/4